MAKCTRVRSAGKSPAEPAVGVAYPDGKLATHHNVVTSAEENVAHAMGGSVGLRGCAHACRLPGSVTRKGVPYDGKYSNLTLLCVPHVPAGSHPCLVPAVAEESARE